MRTIEDWMSEIDRNNDQFKELTDWIRSIRAGDPVRVELHTRKNEKHFLTGGNINVIQKPVTLVFPTNILVDFLRKIQDEIIQRNVWIQKYKVKPITQQSDEAE